MLFDKPPPSEKEETIKPASSLTTSVTRRALVKRLGVAAAASTLAVAAFPSLTVAQDNDQSEDNAANRKPSGFNVLLVHGAFADASSWSGVISLLQKEGHNVLAVQLPLTSLSDDVAVTQQALASTSFSGPTVLVGHSYGGAVITNAAVGAANVIGLVYASAFVPAEGENVFALNSLFAPPEGGSHFIPSYRPGFLWIDPAFFPAVFAADVAPSLARVLAVAQKPISLNSFLEKSGPAAWQTLPSWYLVSKQDKAINPDLERFMAKRINASTVEVDSSHASPLSHPRTVVSLIGAAIKQHKKH